jgi:phage recombination protein Bet
MNMQTESTAAKNSNGNGHGTEVARFAKVRLPWHDAIAERFKDIGVEKATWKVLVEATWPNARTTDAVVMALSYCKARKLDPFKKPVHIVPVWSSDANDGEGGYIETVWPSIAELRTTAFRTGQYAGCDETRFGSLITLEFKGDVKRDRKWQPIVKKVTFPEWAQITVYRMLHGNRVPFAGPKVYWLETFARMGRAEVPNEMWERRGHGQIEKCAEAAALRKAFPEELGNEYCAEEMEGQRLYREMRDITPKKEPAAPLPEPDAYHRRWCQPLLPGQDRGVDANRRSLCRPTHGRNRQGEKGKRKAALKAPSGGRQHRSGGRAPQSL